MSDDSEKKTKRIIMKIDNKFENGQRVYFLNGKKKCQCEEVTCINVFVHADGTTNITYSTRSESSLSENEVFATEDDLKDYIFSSENNHLIDFT